MEIVRKFTALRINESQSETSSFSYDLIPNLSFGNRSEISGGVVEIEHDTEEQAIEYAYNQSRYSTWIIVPIIRFKH
jgi:hypothetical protein